MDVVRPANAEIPAQADVERRKKVVRMAYNKLIDELVAPLQRFRPVCNDDTIDPNKVSAAELEDWATRARAHRSDMDCLR